ncbi:MAG: hypothetical protein QM776_16385 [Rhodocyclaceae bacterium]
MEPFYLPTPEGRIYGLHLPAGGTPRGALLWLPPFAEEAHCARRHLVAAARECQAEGFSSLLIDPLGTGESDGDFSSASWEIWCRHVGLAASWLRERVPAPLWLAGLRAGNLLAADVAAQVMPAGLLCWQPAMDGRTVLDGFLRLKLASTWAADAGGSSGSNAASILADLRDELAAGRSVDVAGFTLSAELAGVLASRGMSWALDCAPRLACLEFRSRQTDGVLPPHSPGLARQRDNWRSQGVQVLSQVVEAPQFWLQHEAPLTPGLGRASAALIGKLEA